MILVVHGLDDAALCALHRLQETMCDDQRQFAMAASGTRFQALRVAQLYAASAIVGEGVELVQMEIGPLGRPVLLGRDLHVSVSHTGTYLAVMIEPVAVGVDIEHRRKRDCGVLKRLFGPDEASAICDDHSFTHAWVRKEAYAKWTGRGLGEYLSDGVYETHVGSFELDQLYVGYAGVRAPESVERSIGDLLGDWVPLSEWPRRPRASVS